MDKNIQLRVIHDHWRTQVFDPFLKGKEGKISVPFCFGLSEEYCSDESSGKRLMIIGQEAKNFTTDYDEWGTEKTQKWAVEYLERQLYHRHAEMKEYRTANCSPFWNFFRFFERNGWTPCWNNIDKAHRYVNNSTQPLTLEYELTLNQKFCIEPNTVPESIIQRELTIAKPNAIIFICGPDYVQSMCKAFGVDEYISQDVIEGNKPSIENLVSRIPASTLSLDTDIPVFWTFHPNRLNYLRKRNEVVNEILDALNEFTTP